MNRLHNLDYLRGIAAFGIMIYHYFSWVIGKFESESFIGRVGIYGVSIFYVLSGLTLFYVYHTRMKPTKNDVKDFAKKRFFRIFPLLWLATLASIVLSKQIPDFENLILNLTGLFGLFAWNTYFAVGAWSIGNELVFYIFFPFFILFFNRSRMALIILSITIFLIYLYFAFYLISVVGFFLSLSSKFLFPFPKYTGLILSIFLTIFLSNFVYQYFEKYFMKMGKEKKFFVRTGLRHM